MSEDKKNKEGTAGNKLISTCLSALKYILNNDKEMKASYAKDYFGDRYKKGTSEKSFMAIIEKKMKAYGKSSQEVSDALKNLTIELYPSFRKFEVTARTKEFLNEALSNLRSRNDMPILPELEEKEIALLWAK